MARTDVLIIGSGIAGLSVAIKVAQKFPSRHCTIITKQESAESNTRYAQGGIAVVSDFERDSFEGHIADTLMAGDGLCDPDVVRHVVYQAPERLKELIALGADFDRDNCGELRLGREGGHNANRIIHHRDTTGLNISTALLESVKAQPNLTLAPHHVAIELITRDEAIAGGGLRACHGARVLNLKDGVVEDYVSGLTVLATGGIGQIYSTTTNPLIATGDGIAIAVRAGAEVSNMEFVQFHPTAFYDVNTSPAFLISEAVRGQGAYLRNSAGERFMFRYHIDGELACRDVVSRAIASEIQASEQPYVYLDCTHLPPETLLSHFPNIYKTCLSRDIDITRDYIPVAPAAHYLCGGIDVDLRSRTSMKNLYAVGECSNTGLHGANRLASNSLLEAIVFAHNCYVDICEALAASNDPANEFFPTRAREETAANKKLIEEMKRSLQAVMTKYAGIVRTSGGLEFAMHELQRIESVLSEYEEEIFTDPGRYELRNMIVCSMQIVKQSLLRKENKGGFYNKSFETNHVLSRAKG